MRRLAAFAAVAFCLTFARFSQAQTKYTISQLATNNTSACSGADYAPLGQLYCNDSFPGVDYVNQDLPVLAYGWVDGITFPSASSTISGFNVWASTTSDPTHYFLPPGGKFSNSVCNYTGNNPITANCSIGLPTLFLTTGTTYNLIVQAVGQPMITNHITNNSVPYAP